MPQFQGAITHWYNPPMAQAPLGSALSVEVEEVRGTLERITFHNPENGYTVARIMPEKGRDLVTIIGTFTNPILGESLLCVGTWSRHPEWGPQLNVQRYESFRPASAAAIEKYLGSGMVRGLGPIRAKRIVEKFGDESLDIIEHKPRKLLDIPGINEALVERIKEAWGEQREIRNIMVYLQSHDVSPLMADKIYKTYKDQAISVVESNPYRLAYDIWGVGFASADKIARNIGIADTDPRRIQAGLIYCMNQAVERSGNVYLTREQLRQAAVEILQMEDVEGQIDLLIEQRQLVAEQVPFSDETALYLPPMLGLERGVANRILELLGKASPAPVSRPKIEAAIGKLDIELSDEQRAAVDLAIDSKIMILTGGPGTGKTTTTRAILAAFKAAGRSVQLASPTGRASKRLSEVTGADAVTIHRLLAYDPASRQFQHGTGNPLNCDVLLVDESSMLDLMLANAVLRSIDDNAQLILVGDVDQLPSVGPGNVLRDMIESGRVPVARLTTIYRQAAESMIVTNAHAVNQGLMPELPSPRETDKDFVFLNGSEAEEIADKIVGVVARSLPKRGFPSSDVQVLTPMQRGSAGAAYLNQRLQDALNPKTPNTLEVQRGGRTYRTGDRVIQLKNNYDKGVFNGDIGLVYAISTGDETLTVKYIDTDVKYDLADLDELGLAYALSIHKSQGSEFPAVVIALHTQHFALLQRQLVYTALTRARRFAVIVGSAKAIAIAVKNDRTSWRLTCLKERLQGLM